MGVAPSGFCVGDEPYQVPAPSAKFILTRDFLIEEYVLQGRSMSDIAASIGCMEKTVSYWIRKHDLRSEMRVNSADPLEGKRFGHWTVVAREENTKNAQARWRCECDCGTMRVVDASSLKMGKSTSCGCLQKHRSFQGVGDLNRSYWNRLADSAAKRGIEFALTIEDGWRLFVEQDRRCALTGIPLVMSRRFTKHMADHTASVDRTDPDGPYALGNVRWVHKDLNRMRWAFRDEQFIGYCRAVAAYADRTV